MVYIYNIKSNKSIMTPTIHTLLVFILPVILWIIFPRSERVFIFKFDLLEEDGKKGYDLDLNIGWFWIALLLYMIFI